MKKISRKDNRKDLIEVYREKKISIHEFTPKVFRYRYVKIEKMYFNKVVRFILSALNNGKIYYLCYEDEIIGYHMITRGKAFRYKFAGKNDVIVGPIYILTQYRGKGYSKQLFHESIECYRSKYGFNSAYADVWKTNKQSNRMSISEGFKVISGCKISKFLRLVEATDDLDSDYQLYELSSSKEKDE